MVSGLILTLHFFVAVYIFLKLKKESLSEGLLGVAFFGLIFAVGWTIATILTNLLFMPEWFTKWYWQPLDSYFWWLIRKELNRDTISLLILTIGEIVFYYFYFLKSKKTGIKFKETNRSLLRHKGDDI